MIDKNDFQNYVLRLTDRFSKKDLDDFCNGKNKNDELVTLYDYFLNDFDKFTSQTKTGVILSEKKKSLLDKLKFWRK